MTPAIIPQKWTIDDYHQMIAAGILSDRPVELLNGEIVEMAPEGEPHAHPIAFSDVAIAVGQLLR